MKMRSMWLVTFLALLMISTLGHSSALAPGSKAVARGNPVGATGPLIVLARADTGFLIYYGHELKPPYIFGTDGKKLFLRCPGDSAVKASGYEWVPWLIPPEQKAPPPMSADAAAEFDAQRRLLQHVQDVSRQGQRQGLRGRALMQRKAEEFRKSPLVDSAVVTNEATVLVYFRRDTSSPYRVTEFTQPRLKPAAEQRPKQRILSEVVPLLQAGGMLVLDYRIELEVPATRVRQFREELAALRSGVRDPATTFIKNSEIVSRFSKPEVPLRSLIEVGH